MKKKFYRCLTAAVLAAALIAGTLPARAAEDLTAGEEIVHLDFNDGGTDDFQIYTNGGSCEISNEDGELAVRITSCGSLDYANQVYYDGFALIRGCEYTYSFDASSDIPRTIEYRLQLNGGDYHAYVSDHIALTPEMQHFTVDFTMEEDTDPAPRLCFNMGLEEDMEGDPGEHTVRFDGISLKVKDPSGAESAGEKEEGPYLAVNQVGYRHLDEKYVIGSDLPDGASFEICDALSGESVYEGNFGDPIEDAASGRTVRRGDFSDFDDAGNYVVKLRPGGAESASFAISSEVYDDLGKALVQMLYRQRCGTATDPETAGDFAHAACHLTEAVIYGTDEKKDVSGGWHDAGDYGRYVVSGAKAAADLMLACRLGYDGDDLGIPESGNGIPDVLDEAEYELKWMLKMQDGETGGVYHKVTCRNFPETVMPQDETDELVISPVSTAATGDFAAVMARASVLYADYDAAFAREAGEAAERAWEYVKDSDDTEGFHNPDGIVTGEYPDAETGDEVFWAASELYLAGHDELVNDVVRRYGDGFDCGFGWAQVSSYAYYDLLADAPEDLSGLLERVRGRFVMKAEDLRKASGGDGYYVTLGTEYSWGSNMQAADNGLHLILAYQLTGTEAYRTAAARQRNYLLGTNAAGYSFVTGFGEQTPQSPHHRPSQVIGEAMPGMLVGGPDAALEDPYAEGVLKGLAPALCYADSDQSYSTNEVTVYWNSSLTALLAAV